MCTGDAFIRTRSNNLVYYVGIAGTTMKRVFPSNVRLIGTTYNIPTATTVYDMTVGGFSRLYIHRGLQNVRVNNAHVVR